MNIKLRLDTKDQALYDRVFDKVGPGGRPELEKLLEVVWFAAVDEAMADE